MFSSAYLLMIVSTDTGTLHLSSMGIGKNRSYSSSPRFGVLIGLPYSGLFGNLQLLAFLQSLPFDL